VVIHGKPIHRQPSVRHDVDRTENVDHTENVDRTANVVPPENVDHTANVDDATDALIESQRRIGAAVGIMMAQHALSYPAALRLLEGLCEHSHLDLAGMAEEVLSDVKSIDGLAGLVEPVAGRLLDLLVEGTALEELLEAVADLAVETVPGCESASVTVIREGVPATVGFSDERATIVDRAQYAAGVGPCLQAARADDVVKVDVATAVNDLATTGGDVATADGGLATADGEEAWRRVARALGITATLSVGIPAAMDIPAALNLHTGREAGWPTEALDAADFLATYAGDAITLLYRLRETTDLWETTDPDANGP